MATSQPQGINLPELEAEILEFWRQNEIPSKTLALRRGKDEFVFYEGPPTANAKPGTHHIMARAFKDIYARFQTMRGRYVHRQAGWDCHGLPVEIEVERKLGFTNKQQVVSYGVEAFNKLCRESVEQYVSDWEQFSERIAFWLDYSDPYRTMDNQYIESVWWSLKELWNKGLLYEGHKVAHYCPRCETPLSDHELGQPDVYRDIQDPSLYVKLRLVDAPAHLSGASIAIWTTTPWTLLSNLAVAVNPDATYVKVETDLGQLIVGESLVESVVPNAQVLERFGGTELVGVRYEPPFSIAEAAGDPWRIVAADFVTTEDGTGLVHIAPAFGEDDLAVCEREGIGTFNPVDASGKFAVGPWASVFVKDADNLIIEDLAARGLVIRSERHSHSYPHCWRCQSPLLNYSLKSWYISTTTVRSQMLEANSKIGWVPTHIRDGRFGKWLENNVDWSLSRYRFWGTPLPAWRCGQGHLTFVDSRDELSERTGRDLSDLDLHRPFVDEVTFACGDCGEVAQRVTDLIDVWYDSGAMPFAQLGYPKNSSVEFSQRFPADFIAEAVDQTRGWFYSLLAEGVLLFGESPYRNVVCHGHLVDADGRKMSKTIGNVIDPAELLDRYGADVLRMFFFSAGQPGDPRRLSTDSLDGVARSLFIRLYNVWSLYETYSEIDGFDPLSWSAPDPAFRPELDRWLLSELHGVIEQVTESLETYDALAAGKLLIDFVDDLSNWYIRRSRRRFWREALTDTDEADKASAYFTLFTTLSTLSQLLAPMTPYFAEFLYRKVVVDANEDAVESVHLTDFPVSDARFIDPELSTAMAVAREIVSLGHSARSDASIKVRTPLASATLLAPFEFRADIESMAELIVDELNVGELAFADDARELVDLSLKPNYPTAGPVFGNKIHDLAAALATADPATIELLENGQDVSLTLGGELTVVSPDYVEIRREPAAGTAFAFEGGFGVSLDLHLTEDLAREGLARELVHTLQNQRKAQGFETTDRISLELFADDEVLGAVKAHEDWVTSELLVTSLALWGPAAAADYSGADLVVAAAGPHSISLRITKTE